MTAKTRATRAGFTLVEILMVIAIIAVLAALLVVGLGKVRGQASIVQARNDISQLDTVLTTFKKDFGFYPPSHVTPSTGVMRFMVPNRPSGGTAQNEASLAVLQRMFPRWNPSATVDASGNLTIPLAGQFLDPNQAMVYFLGGPAALNPALGQPGWDVATPTVPAGNTKKGPYFDFPAGRLIVPEATSGYVSGNALPNFVDPWGVPYAYFAAGGDNYDGRLFFPFGSSFPADLTTPSTQYRGTVAGMRPVRMGNKWVNAGKCQIVSAGPNLKFGPGSQSSATVAATTPLYTQAEDIRPGVSTGYAEKDAGEDDLANFNEGTNLGTSTN